MAVGADCDAADGVGVEVTPFGDAVEGATVAVAVDDAGTGGAEIPPVEPATGADAAGAPAEVGGGVTQVTGGVGVGVPSASPFSALVSTSLSASRPVTEMRLLNPRPSRDFGFCIFAMFETPFSPPPDLVPRETRAENGAFPATLATYQITLSSRKPRD
jgi:hypothetical protein